MKTGKPNPQACALIDRLGGTNAVAKLFQITPASVSCWRHIGIPKARLMYLEVAFPDVIAAHATNQIQATPAQAI